jgi:hypothetical protein
MYHPFIDENGSKYGSFEVWEVSPDDPRTKPATLTTHPLIEALGTTLPSIKTGWYWWSCFPGCLPDGGAFGPFTTESDAISDATEV